jgi:energy-coupling factor transport system substrate-specific component
MEAHAEAQFARFDEITTDLRALRSAAGDPSFGELARRVIAQRVARGISEWEARVGRTTVYDAFRPGRQLLDPDLIGEIVRALGGSDDEAAEWVRRCEATRQLSAHRSDGDHLDANEPALDSVVAASTEVQLPSVPLRPILTRRVQVAVVLGCIAVNLGGRLLVNTTHMPLYLDMVGTAIAAILLGPWKAVVVGLSTSVAGAATSGFVSIPFAPVEVVGALIWGYGVRRFRLGTTVPRYFALNVVVALACSVVAVPVIVWLDHGVTGNGADQLTRTMDLFWHSLFAAVCSQNILTSLVDKLISGFIALGVAEALPAGAALGSERLRLASPWLQVHSLLTGAGRTVRDL